MTVCVCVCVCVCVLKPEKQRGKKVSTKSEMTKIPSILEYDGTSISKQSLTFRRNLRPLSSRSKQSYHSKLA